MLPTEFGYDKRREHIAAATAGGRISREAALNMLETSLWLDSIQ